MIRRICILIAALAAASTASGLDLSLQIGDFDTHSELLGGAVPTMVEIGGVYTGISLLPENRTAVGFLVGGAYYSRDVWKDEDGLEKTVPPDVLTIWTGRWEVIFSQGFLRREKTGKDFLTLYGGLAGRVEVYPDTGSIDYITLFDSPESGGIWSNALKTGVILDATDYDGIIPRGVIAELEFHHAPKWLLNDIYGKSSYSLLSTSVTGYLPLFVSRADSGRNTFAVYLANRVRGDLFLHFDSDVPLFAQDSPSLGSKMRGLERFAMAGSFTAVNNFDIRVSGPEVFADRLYPRMSLFLDVGYSDGKNANAAAADAQQMYVSAGAEAGISFFDFLNAGYRAAWMLYNSNKMEKSFVHGVYMSLQFK